MTIIAKGASGTSPSQLNKSNMAAAIDEIIKMAITPVFVIEI